VATPNTCAPTAAIPSASPTRRAHRPR
jgi:hypothetical protein